MLNAMRGLFLLFLVWPFVLAKATSAPFSVRQVVEQVTTPKVLKVSINSKLLPANHSLPVLSSELKPNATIRNGLVKAVTSVQCGNDQTFNDVMIDTASNVLWVGAGDPYVPGPKTTAYPNSSFSIQYTIESAKGPAFRDTVVIGQATATGQIIGAANTTYGFDLLKPIDGILGLGPFDSSFGQVTGFNSTPTFVETLVAQGQISAAMFGLYIAPLGQNGTADGYGEITFGGIDESKIQGPVIWVPQIEPIGFRWEFNVSSCSFGSITLNGPTFAVTDTGFLGIGIPFDTFFAILAAYNGTVIEDNSVLDTFLAFNSSIVPSLPNLNITIGSETFSIPPSMYIVPEEAYPMLNATVVPGLQKSWFASAGPDEFYLGHKFFEKVYTVYNMDEHCIGFAHISQY